MVASMTPSRVPSVLSTISLVKSVSPVFVRSAVGVPGATAPGIGRCSFFARSKVVRVRLPPAEVPKTPMFFGGCVFKSSR
jgi:hypothetical protein